MIEEKGHFDEDVLTRAMIGLGNTLDPLGASPSTTVYGYKLRSLWSVIQGRNAETIQRKAYYDQGSQGLKLLYVDDEVVFKHEETKRCQVIHEA